MNVSLTRTIAALDRLVECAQPFNGLFPSVLELDTGKMPFILPPAIDGQRDCDRSFPGSNLMHDHIVLGLMYDLTGATGEPRFAEAADRYLQWFAVRCTNTPTGLFPWGEHAFWSLYEDRPGSSYPLARVATMATHDHLHQAPVWLWEKLWSFNPLAVDRFCLGLTRHYFDMDPPEYNRHTNLLQHYMKRVRNDGSCDFPRHGGLWMLDWCFTYARTGSPTFRQYIGRTLDYWWDKRTPGQVLPIASRPRAGQALMPQAAQTISLAVSLLESAELVDPCDPELAATMRHRGNAYLDAVLAAPHDLDHGRFAGRLADTRSGEVVYSPSWGSGYGCSNSPSSSFALLALCAYRLNQDARLLDMAERIGRCCAVDEIPAGVAVPVKDAGMQLGLLTDLYSITGERQWLDHAERWSHVLLPIFLDRDLPRAAIGSGIYESQCLPGHFLRGLARTALLAEGKDIGPDYTLR